VTRRFFVDLFVMALAGFGVAGILLLTAARL
jgi:hypothetical protein